MRLLVVLLSLVFSHLAQAATTTDRHILGFSKDGRYFVFEEFAVYDGAGIPKATLYVIDTLDDSWVPGTPVSTKRGEDDVVEQPERDYAEVERELIASVRKEVREKAASILNRIGPLVPGKQRVRNTIYDFSNDPRTAKFSVRDYVQSVRNSRSDDKWRLDLVRLEFQAREDCFGLAEKMHGFKLVLTEERRGKSRVIAEDRSIPKSRPCPIENFIEEIITYQLGNGEIVLVTLIRFAHPGFEGADGSLLAVTARIKK